MQIISDMNIFKINSINLIWQVTFSKSKLSFAPMSCSICYLKLAFISLITCLPSHYQEFGFIQLSTDVFSVYNCVFYLFTYPRLPELEILWGKGPGICMFNKLGVPVIPAATGPQFEKFCPRRCGAFRARIKCLILFFLQWLKFRVLYLVGTYMWLKNTVKKHFARLGQIKYKL